MSFNLPFRAGKTGVERVACWIGCKEVVYIPRQRYREIESDYPGDVILSDEPTKSRRILESQDKKTSDTHSLMNLHGLCLVVWSADSAKVLMGPASTRYKNLRSGSEDAFPWPRYLTAFPTTMPTRCESVTVTALVAHPAPEIAQTVRTLNLLSIGMPLGCVLAAIISPNKEQLSGASFYKTTFAACIYTSVFHLILHHRLMKSSTDPESYRIRTELVASGFKSFREAGRRNHTPSAEMGTIIGGCIVAVLWLFAGILYAVFDIAPPSVSDSFWLYMGRMGMYLLGIVLSSVPFLLEAFVCYTFVMERRAFNGLDSERQHPEKGVGHPAIEVVVVG